MNKCVLLNPENVITANAWHNKNSKSNNLLLSLKHVTYLSKSHFVYMTLARFFVDVILEALMH